MPFTLDEILDTFEVYNRAVWPAQGVAYALGIAAIFLTLRPTRTGHRITHGILGLFWIWTGVMFFALNLRTLFQPAQWIAVLFVVQGILFLINGTLRVRFGYRFDTGVNSIVGGVFLLFALLGIPLVASLMAHPYPRAPMFGISPTPLAVFTFGLLLLADDAVPRYLIAIPFAFSLTGLVTAPALGLWEDAGMFVAGLLGSLLLIRREHQITAERMAAAQGKGKRKKAKKTAA